MLSYCDISATPAFQNLVTEVTPVLGDAANKEVYRDYLEYNGMLRNAEEIIAKKKSEYFSPYNLNKAQIERAADAEIVMSNKDKFAELGTSVPKKNISNQQIINLKKIISRVNNEFAKNKINKVYRIETKQVGQSDNFTWDIKVFNGRLDVEAKVARLSDIDFDKNVVPRLLNQGTQSALSFEETRSNYSQEIIRKLADGLGQQIGVNYSFIRPADAVEITKNSKNPWAGQKSFFFNGQIYFIAGELTPGDILHEFVHPIVKSIAKENPSLFNGLYNKTIDTVEGRKVIEEVRDLYPDFDVNSAEFKEEVLVRSLEKMSDLNNKNLQATPLFKKFVDNLLYSIKQFLRKAFGQKIRISDLDQNTTLEQLSTMLAEGGSFELDPEVISDSDLVAYKNEYNKYMYSFVAEKADVKEIEALVNDYFNTVAKQLKSVQDKNDLGELSDILANNYKTGELQIMKKNLKAYQTLIQSDSKIMADEVELTRQRTMAVINSLGNVDNMVGKIFEGLKEIVKDIDNPDNVQRALYYQKVLNYWGDFVNKANRTLEANGVSGIKMIDSVNASVRRANDMMDDFYSKASKGVLWDKLRFSAEKINEKWTDRIKTLKEQKAPVEIIKKAEEDAAREKITPEMIEKALKGELKDLNFANAYLEGYGYSPDPVVGGLALFVKDSITEVEAKAQSNFNVSAQILKPLLDKVGYNPNDPGKIGEMLGQKEKVGHVNLETGEFEEREVWRFINEFSGADLVRDQFLFKIKEASNKYGETGSEADKKTLADIQAEWETHRRKYFNSEYTEDFYKAYDLLKKDAIGKETSMKMNDLYDDLNLLSGQLSVANTNEILDIADQIEVIRRQIKQLSSMYDIVGNLKTGKELAIAQRLQEFNKAVEPLYHSEEIPGAFESALQAYEQKLLDEGKKVGSLEYDDLKSKWLEKNTRIAIKDNFWTKMNMISKVIKDILSSIPQQEALNFEIDQAYQVIKDMVKGNRDESGQPIGGELSPEKQEKVRLAQERINEARNQLNNMSGLTKSEQEEIQSIMAKFHIPRYKLSKKESLRLTELLSKQGKLRLDKIQRAELNSLFSELDDLRTKEPTDSYVDTVNSFLDGMNSEIIYDILGTLNIDKGNAYLVSNEEIADKLFTLSPEFEEWFQRNHTIKEGVDWETQAPKITWERTYAWNVIKPREDKYYDKTSVKNAAGQTVVIDGLPSLKYFKRLVKDEYITKKIDGVTVDNRGYWLPKTMAQGAPDDRYINKEYNRLKNSSSDVFNLLEAMKKIHLKNQEGLSKKGKLYLDMPRYRKQTVERLRGDKPVGRIIQRVKDFWHNVKDRFDQGFNFDDNMQLVKMDLFDDETTGIPIAGLSNLDIEEVSTDVVFTSLRYMLSAERNKQLTKAAPVARMIQSVVNNKNNYPLDSKILNNSTIVNMSKKKDKYLRAKAVNNFIEREFEGIVNTGFGSDSIIAQNFSNALFKQASGAFLALNIPSAVKNSIGQKFQGLIESTAGRYMSTKDFLAAEGWATGTAFKISGEIYKQGPKTLDVQITELFDPERGRFNQHFGESITRTAQKDYSFLLLQRMTDFRRWSQLQASLQTFGGMMKHQMVSQNGKMIPYLEAWEIKDGKIQLKEGIDKGWGVSYDSNGELVLGEKFKQKRNEIHRVMDNLNGAMDKESRPEADRYLLFRYVSFFRRYLTSMLTNRFAKNRVDYQLGNFKEGYYITFLKLLADTFKNMGRNLPFAPPEQKAAFMRFMTEAGTVAILKFLVIPLIFGFDDDDKDRFKKLRAKSGPLPWLGVPDNADPFKFGGWLSNHLLLNIMQINGENNQFLPFPGAGLNSYKQMLDIRSLALGPNLKVGFEVIQDVANLVTGDDHAYYQKSIGPYTWQEEGNAKIFNHIAKAWGISGTNIDPSNAIKNYQSIQNR